MVDELLLKEQRMWLLLLVEMPFGEMATIIHESDCVINRGDELWPGLREF